MNRLASPLFLVVEPHDGRVALAVPVAEGNANIHVFDHDGKPATQVCLGDLEQTGSVQIGKDTFFVVPTSEVNQ